MTGSTPFGMVEERLWKQKMDPEEQLQSTGHSLEKMPSGRMRRNTKGITGM